MPGGLQVPVGAAAGLSGLSAFEIGLVVAAGTVGALAVSEFNGGRNTMFGEESKQRRPVDQFDRFVLRYLLGLICKG